MTKFLIESKYTAQGLKGVQREGGTARKEASRRGIESPGGSLESLYFAFGDHDVYTIADLPDNTSAAAVALAVDSTGAITTRIVVLLTPEEIDTAASRSVDYRAPGA